MAFLDADVQISFGTGPNEEPVWQSVGSDLVAFTTRRGKQGAVWATGTAKITLNNLLRQYEQFFEGSPYYPNVIPRKQIRVVAGGVTRFTGKIERFETIYPSKNKALLVIHAADILKDLNFELQIPYVQEVLEDLDKIDELTKAYYRFSELAPNPLPTGTVPLVYGQASDYSGAGNNGSIETFDSARLLLGQSDPITDENDGAFTFIPGGGGQTSYVLAPPQVFGKGRPARFAISCFLKTTTLSGGVIVFINKQSASAPYALDIIATGKAAWRWASGSTLTSTTTVADGGWHQVALTYDGATAYLVVDGLVEAQTNLVVAQTSGENYSWYVGGLPIGYGPSFNGSLDEVIFAPGFIAPDRLKAHYVARNSLLHQWTDERIGWLLDRLGLAGNRSLGIGRTKLQSASNLGGKSALNHAQLVAETEGGQFFVRADGSPEFVSRYGPYGDRPASSTPQLSLVDAQTGPGTEYTSAEFETTDDDLASQVEVSRRTGITARARSLSATVKYGSAGYRRRGATVQALNSESYLDRDAQDMADWWQAILEEPARLVKSMEVVVENFPDALDLDLFDRCEVAHQPTGGGPEVRFETLITNINDAFSAQTGDYRITLDQSDEQLLLEPLWVWGSSTWGESTRWGWESQPPRSATAWRWGSGAWGQTTEWL